MRPTDELDPCFPRLPVEQTKRFEDLLPIDLEDDAIVRRDLKDVRATLLDFQITRPLDRERIVRRDDRQFLIRNVRCWHRVLW